MFPSATLSIYHIGPEVSLPKVSLPPEEQAQPALTARPEPARAPSNSQKSSELSSKETMAISHSDMEELKSLKIWKPKISELKMAKFTRNEIGNYGVPSYTSPINDQLQIAALRSPYQDIHTHFGPFDPYTDVFFAFQPGFGFPSQHTPGIPQIASQSEWGGVIPLILQTKCSLFVTGFSPEDVERDVRSLEGVPGIAGEFDWILTPGENPFKSERWEVAEFDPRLMVRTNWGIWGIRGQYFISLLDIFELNVTHRKTTRVVGIRVAYRRCFLIYLLIRFHESPLIIILTFVNVTVVKRVYSFFLKLQE
jgi:splicing suppressor protein 51